jgi:hypothetical protein
MRDDGQCDADVFQVSTEKSFLCTYAILDNPSELRDHLSATYDAILRGESEGEVSS